MKKLLGALLVAGSLLACTEEQPGSLFTGKTFNALFQESPEEIGQSKKGEALKVLFYQDTTGVFRTMKSGSFANVPFVWRVDGDSMTITPLKSKYPMKFGITKEAGSILLRQRSTALLLIEVD